MLLAVLAIAAVWFLVDRGREAGFDTAVFLATLQQMDPRWLAAATALVLLTYYGRVLRWAVMIRHLAPTASHWRLFVATAIGFTAVVLFGRPGEFVRPYLIARREGTAFSAQLAVWMLERICDMLVVLILFAFGLTQIPDLAGFGPKLRFLIEAGGRAVMILGAVCLGVLFVMGRHHAWAERRIHDALAVLPASPGARARKMVTAFLDGIESIRRPQSAILVALYTLLEWLIIAAAYYCLLEAFPATARRSAADVLAFLGLVALGSAVQVPGIGGGMQVASVIVLTELFGVSLSAATGVALVTWIITFVVIVPVGIALALHEGINWRKLKELEVESQP
ncbi:MAG: lysylphosphatidylglycerol synthase transmembrane domain-containing protein [Bryobacteraceae bacterium]|nr:lysylphosphatidylglycerol synthase transmembrane domain-containing protein [Bryobacteraceae bacterium]